MNYYSIRPTGKLLLSLACIINLFHLSFLFPMQEQIEKVVTQKLEKVTERANEVYELTNQAVDKSNESMALAYHSNATSIRAYEKSQEALDIANHVSVIAEEAKEGLKTARAKITQQGNTAAAHLEREYNRFSTSLVESVERTQGDLAKKRNALELENKIRIERVKIHEKQQRGIYEQRERIRAGAEVEAETVKWKKIWEILGDSKLIMKIVLAIAVIALCIYAIKYGLPILIDYLNRPRVISETSRTDWFDWWSPQPESIDINDLVFAPALQKQLTDLLAQIQSAKQYNEKLPNVLFYGPSGVGKTTVAKALAYLSGFDYAITSGSEFAKITDLNLANNELRKFLNWTKNDDKKLLVFIDEIESLFADRKLPTTPKITQDFINTFLALIPEQSQEDVMFVFGTNHPFKIDEAIVDRIGKKVEFTLPEAVEREEILTRYLAKLAEENENAIVLLHQDVMQNVPLYAKKLEGFSPRAIKFVVEEMIIKARRQQFRQLTHEIALAVLDHAKHSQEHAEQWKKEREAWASVASAA